MNSFVL